MWRLFLLALLGCVAARECGNRMGRSMFDFSEADWRVHNEMQHIDSAMRDVSFDAGVGVVEEWVRNIGNFHIGAWRAHKHFNLREGEALLSTLQAPEKKTRLLVNVVAAATLSNAVPVQFKLVDGEWRPVQYFATDDTEGVGGALRERSAAMQTSVMLDAMQDLRAKLMSMGLHDTIGLSTLPFAEIAANTTGEVVEFTNETARAQFFIQDEPTSDEAVTTHVFFNPDPKQARCNQYCALTVHCRARVVCIRQDGEHFRDQAHDALEGHQERHVQSGPGPGRSP